MTSGIGSLALPAKMANGFSETTPLLWLCSMGRSVCISESGSERPTGQVTMVSASRNVPRKNAKEVNMWQDGVYLRQVLASFFRLHLLHVQHE